MAAAVYLYALGSNGSYQLGLNHANDISSGERCSFIKLDNGPVNTTSEQVPLATGESIIKIASGGNHTLLLTSSGSVWSTGYEAALEPYESSSADQDEHSHGWRQLSWNQAIPPNSKVIDIAANWETSYFATLHDVYSCGGNSKGELGRGQTSNRHLEKCFGLSEHETGSIVAIRTCMNHVVVLSSTGRLYGWGASRKGQLGADAQRCGNIVWIPRHIPMNFTIEQVVTGRDFTVTFGDRGEVCFLGDVSRLGFQEEAIESFLENSRQTSHHIHAGWTHVFVQNQSQLGGFGKNARGQIFSGPLPSSITQLAVGSEHSIALLTDGKVIAWGWGEHGNCGQQIDCKGNVADRTNIIFTPSDGQTVLGVGAGCATSFFWLQEA